MVKLIYSFINQGGYRERLKKLGHRRPDRSWRQPYLRRRNCTNLYIVPAILHRRPNGRMSVTISWLSDDERFVVKADVDMMSQDGDQIMALISTITNTQHGCINGYARVEAVQASPQTWRRNIA